MLKAVSVILWLVLLMSHAQMLSFPHSFAGDKKCTIVQTAEQVSASNKVLSNRPEKTAIQPVSGKNERSTGDVRWQ